MKEQMQALGMRVDLDTRNEKMGYKIRQSQTQKIPYQLVVGDQEVENESVTVRKYGEKKTETIPFSKFLEHITDEVRRFGK